MERIDRAALERILVDALDGAWFSNDPITTDSGDPDVFAIARACIDALKDKKLIDVVDSTAERTLEA